MLAVPGFPVGRHPDGAFSRNRTLVFADTAADAMFGINIGLLKPYQNFNGTPWWRWCFKGPPGCNLKTSFPAADNSSRTTVWE